MNDPKSFDELPLIKEWKAKYQEKDIDKVIDSYLRMKSIGQNRKNWRQHVQTKKIKIEAQRVFEEILSKKLFNAVCEWQAQLQDYPIKNTFQVKTYFKHLFGCPFIHPITPEELDTYIDYWTSALYREFPYDVSDVEVIKTLGQGKDYQPNSPYDLHDPGLEYPAWYAWYDRRFDTQGMMMLPDKQMAKEQMYLAGFRKKRGLDRKKRDEQTENRAFKQGLAPTNSTFHEFAHALEDLRMQAYFHEMEKATPSMRSERAASETWYLSNVFHRNVPVKSNADWRDGIIEAAVADQQRLTLKYLPEFYDQYLKENYFYDRYFDVKSWEGSQDMVNNLQKTLDEGKAYIEENPDEFKDFDWD